MLDEAKQRTQAVNNGKEHADLRNGGEVDAGEQAVGHDGRHFADLVGADDRHHGAQCRQHERKSDDAKARFHIDARALERADGITVFLFHFSLRSGITDAKFIHITNLLYFNRNPLNLQPFK